MKIPIFNFSPGIVNDPRDPSNGVSRVVSNFDIITSPNRLIPYRSSESGDSGASTSQKQNFCMALWLPNSTNVYRIFSLGVKSGAGTAEVLMKDVTTGGSSDLGDGGWMTPANNQSSGGATSFNLFVYYKKTGLIYGASGGTTIWAFDPTASAAWADTSHLLNYTNIAQGVVHSKDDILYIPHDNKIASNNNGSWTDAALTLPSQYFITSICEFNNYLAIAAAPLDSRGNSRVYLWDRSSTLSTVTENIDWGTGQIRVLEEISGYLVGISLDGANSTRFTDHVVFRYYTGAGAVAYTQLLGATSTVLLRTKQKINNRIFFGMSISLNGSVRDGVWSFGKNPNGNGFSLAHERTPNNDTSIGNGPLTGFFYVGDYLFISYVNASAAYALSKTDDSANYSATSIFESVINPNMAQGDKLKMKQLTSIAVGYKTLSTIAGQVVVKYKVDGGSYVTVYTATVTGVNVVESSTASGVAFTAGREYEFRLESTLGADIISFDYDYDVMPTLA